MRPQGQKRRLENQLCYQLYRASKEISRCYARALKPFQITFSQYLVLQALFDDNEVLTTELGARTGMGIGTLNPILNRLEEHQWITRQTSEEDRRTSFVTLTQKAYEYQCSFEEAIEEELSHYQLQEVDVQALYSQLLLVQQHLQRSKEEEEGT